MHVSVHCLEPVYKAGSKFTDKSLRGGCSVKTSETSPHLWNLTIHYHIRNSPIDSPFLIQKNPIHITLLHFIWINSNLIFFSAPRSSKLFLSFRFPHHKPVCISLVPHTWYRHTRFIVLDLVTRLITYWLELEIMKPFIMQFSPVAFNFLLVAPHTFFNNPIL